MRLWTRIGIAAAPVCEGDNEQRQYDTAEADAQVSIQVVHVWFSEDEFLNGILKRETGHAFKSVHCRNFVASFLERLSKQNTCVMSVGSGGSAWKFESAYNGYPWNGWNAFKPLQEVDFQILKVTSKSACKSEFKKVQTRQLNAPAGASCIF